MQFYSNIYALLFLCIHTDSFLVRINGRVDRQDLRRYSQSVPSPRSTDSNSVAASDQASLLQFLQPSEDCQVNRMSSTDLAYIGDAVYELFVRSRTVWPSKKTSDLQTQVVGLVRGESQVAAVNRTT